MEPGSENRDLLHVETSSPKPEIDADIAPVAQKIGATSIAEIEKAYRGAARNKKFS
jgi:hypothetical protein